MIPIFNYQRNFWVVRADKGKLFQKFLKEDFVGIAHIDKVDIKKEKIDEDFFEEIYQNSFSKEIGRNKFVQIRAFIEKISIDDWVITLNHKYICVGKIITNAELVTNDTDPVFENKLNLRRKVVWGQRIKRTNLPNDLLNSLKTNLTVFNINKCAESIYHTLFPFFLKGSTFHTTIFINAENKIKTKDIANLFEQIANVEKISNSVIREYYPDLDFSLTSTVKAEFNSPGGIRVQYKSFEIQIPIPKWLPLTIIIYTFLFGNDLSGFNGIIPTESRQDIIKYILTQIDDKQIQELKSSLNLSTPNQTSYELISNDEKFIQIKIDKNFEDREL